MIAGLATQVATLLVFGVLAADHAYAVYKHHESVRPATAELRRSWQLCEGWKSPTMRNQGLFIGLNSLPVGGCGGGVECSPSGVVVSS
jgi:hypothetical protein